ncbi:MAG TPA: PIN domain-containing protein [Planctomycetota bacterium]|jgi:predicted nucleic acid-binding protein
MHLFVDTNIFLSFYHLTSEELEELRKLIVLMDQGRLVLHLPDQVKDEFWRNRESKIADALKRLREQAMPSQFPQACKDYPEYELLRESIKAFRENHSRLSNKLADDVKAVTLHADAIIQGLFSKAQKHPISSGVVERARLRLELGNPPGKSGSLGDAVNWEILLSDVPTQSDLYFVSEDSDYCSPLDEYQFNQYLSLEWRSQKSSNLFFFRKLSAFFREKFPEIKLASELARDGLIEDLRQSNTFAQTHLVIANLAKYADFSDAQVESIFEAALSNSQVNMILGDTDVREFLTALIRAREGKTTSLLRLQLKKMLDRAANNE